MFVMVEIFWDKNESTSEAFAFKVSAIDPHRKHWNWRVFAPIWEDVLDSDSFIYAVNTDQKCNIDLTVTFIW